MMTDEEKVEINYLEQPTIFDKLIEPIQACVEGQAQELPRYRRPTYPYLMFFRTLICYCILGIPALKLFINTQLNKGLLPNALNLTCSVPAPRRARVLRRTSQSGFGELARKAVSKTCWGTIHHMNDQV